MDWLIYLRAFLMWAAWLPVCIYLLIFKGENGALFAGAPGLAYVLLFLVWSQAVHEIALIPMIDAGVGRLWRWFPLLCTAAGVPGPKVDNIAA